MSPGIGLADEPAADDRLDDQAAPRMPNVPMAAAVTAVTTGLRPGCQESADDLIGLPGASSACQSWHPAARGPGSA
jgi:hypothetical protein